ncbi:MAG TPA: efflux RND transporter periplasmic adaptor subunit [Burkholderiales bacterium]|nr:efflux RND transporter periplasmic adaptor subunit [Burkholderiales bacterium]
MHLVGAYRAPSLSHVLGAAPLLLLALLGACGKAPQGPPPRGPANVTVMTVAPREVPVSFEFVAQTQSPRAVNIQARVSAFLDRRVYTEGALVKTGQVLFLMDKKPFEAQLDQAKAALQQQKAAMDNALANLKRTKPLVDQDALAQKDLDDATGQYQQSAAAVEQAKQQVIQAQLNLSYCTITSPVDGAASFAQQADGTYISTSNSLLTTVSVLSPMWVNFSISENQFQNFQDGLKRGVVKAPADGNYEVEIVLVDGSVFPSKGHITFQQPDYDTKTGTFLVRAAVDNPQSVLRPNQFVRARVIGITRPNAVLIPQRAVQQGAKGHFVWVVNQESKVEPRPVTVGQWYGDDWFINEGLTAGERVVVEGAVALSPGATVQVTQALAAGQPEATGGTPK